VPTVRVDGEEAYFRGGSSGPYTLVLVHGASHQGGKWDRILSQVANAVAPDLPGHGASRGPGRERIADYAAWLERFAAALGLERPLAVGHSMGGAICLSAVVAGGDWSGLGLVATGARLRVHPDLLQVLRAGRVPEHLAEMMFGPRALSGQIRQEERALAACDPVVRAMDFAACDAFDLRPRLAEVAVPTEVMVGGEDRLTPAPYGEFLAQAIPGAQFTLVPDAGHLLMVEQPAVVLRVLRRLVARARAADGTAPDAPVVGEGSPGDR
jgi:pimeloyl-ACP methyl ester carboxylesterase